MINEKLSKVRYRKWFKKKKNQNKVGGYIYSNAKSINV